ncbi:hypothetical protein HMI55_005268 [Coelomomyces lativittatus]|nr:hypothetical protein HMI55_005268 [Coelomomyces lativittatus]
MFLENLKKLKALEYLNLALNNISVIENLEGCESLKKLDLTINFIEDLECINNLVPCRELRELYLTGNPITTKSGYREYTLCTLPQLLTLDGTPITPSERIQSQQKYEEIVNLQKQLPRPELPKIPNAEELDRIDQLTKDEIAYQFQKTTSDHTIEARMTTARQLAKLRNEKETNLKNEKKN